MKLTVDILVKCGADRAAAARYVDLFNELLPMYQVNSYLRVCHFLAQLMHESWNLSKVEEEASGKAYEFRKDLGNIHAGDGVKFKGRGLIQITGRSNYEAIARKFGIDCVNQPEKLEEPKYAVGTALWYWGGRGLNRYADRDQVYEISCLINIGHVPNKDAKKKIPNGYAQRQSSLVKCKRALAPLFL